jgi:hypothetical protein
MFEVDERDGRGPSGGFAEIRRRLSDSESTGAPEEVCGECGGLLNGRVHEHKPDNTGLDDGPYLPGYKPRKKPAPKTREELAAIRAKAWATRRAK